jgi:hypothetical protein
MASFQDSVGSFQYGGRERASIMNHKHRAALHALFAHPVSNNIDPRIVKSTLQELGAEISHGGHGQLIVRLNGLTHGFHDSHHDLSKDEVSALRKFLTEAGVDPVRDYPL